MIKIIDSARFKVLLKDGFVPVLRQYGFQGSGFSFRRIMPDHFIHALSLQGNRYGGSCCVELGIHVDFLSNIIGKIIKPQKTTPYDCIIRRRLSLDGDDYWWGYGESDQDAIKNITDLEEVFIQVGLPFFEEFRDFPGPLGTLTIEDIERGNLWGTFLGPLGLALMIAESQDRWGIELGQVSLSNGDLPTRKTILG